MHDEIFNRDALLKEAVARNGLSDFGDTWFFAPMDVLLTSVRAEARLSEQGAMVQRERMLTGLGNRLRMIADIKKHPEILAEEATVAGAVLGLPRTGSTMLHRLLATAPAMTAIKWWETQNYAPFKGEERGQPVKRREMAVFIQEAMLKAVPELTSIHPFSIEEPDEEVIIMDQVFIGTMGPASMYIPSYVKWLDTADQRPAYRDLRTVLQYLQWQDVSRAGKRWVLKTPSHLSAPEALLECFPEAVLITTHRDPLQTIPSYCSMVDSLYRLASPNISKKEVGTFTEKTWARYLNNFAKLRARMPGERFLDVKYEEQIVHPLKQVETVLNRVGVAMNPQTQQIMKDWLDENAREKRAAHKYDMKDFGLTAEQMEEDFAAYKKQFLS